MKEIQPSHFRTVPSSIAIELPQAAIAEFCQRWKIQEFYLFGSVLRSDFRPESDIDVIVSFALDAHWGLLALVQMKEELEAMFDRDVDLLTKKSIEQSENWIRRKEILSAAQMIYDAR
jgi:predicted nucleotidyltransferase